MDRKLDLSRLTDEEAKHVWEVIQRDFTLRKNEEQRLGRRAQSVSCWGLKLAWRHHVHLLSTAVQVLLNSKRQCLDCQLYTCKACSRYNKKEHGWVCDNCRMTRVLKMGTLGWYHDNVRNRFKRFGSAKVMRSLYKRLNGDGRDDDTRSMPDVRSHVYNGLDDEYADMEAQRYKAMRKSKRLLSVHPMDFDSEDYFSYSRRPSVQQLQEDRGYMDYDMYNHRAHRRKSLDRYNMRDDYGDNRMVRTRSLSKISAVARQQYVDTSDEEEQRFPVHGSYRRRNSRGSQEQGPPINELNKRMFAIENLLSRLEEKIGPDEQTEEEKLRRKLSELAGNLSDRNLSSDDEMSSKKTSSKISKKKGESREHQAEAALSSSSDEGPSNAQKVYIAAGKSYDLEGKLRRLEQSAKNRFGGTTDSDLSELEDVVALTAARVQSAESEVSDIESKLAALSSGSKKKSSVSQRKRSSLDFSAVLGGKQEPECKHGSEGEREHDSEHGLEGEREPKSDYGSVEEHEHKSEHGSEGERERDSEHGSEGERERDSEHGSEGERERDSEHGSEGERERDSEHGSEGERERDSEHGSEGERERDSEHGSEGERERDSEHGSEGERERDSEHGSEGERERDSEHGSEG
ncbi:hypothetical protein WMY93_026129 [Mugilogobius chulae]|uniref:RabBD domain-containing protein n=1 Tax=Mugilogobius chulae TaxID=88201 RepID=A0AAW0N140_9GOBI